MTVHLRGTARQRLGNELRRRYEQGDTIRGLATATGRKYTFIRVLLLEAGTAMRPHYVRAGGAR